MKIFKFILKDIAKLGLKILAGLTGLTLVSFALLLMFEGVVPTMKEEMNIESGLGASQGVFMVVLLLVVASLLILILLVPITSRRRYFETAMAVGSSRRDYVNAILGAYLVLAVVICLVSMGIFTIDADYFVQISELDAGNVMDIVMTIPRTLTFMMQLALFAILHYKFGYNGWLYLIVGAIIVSILAGWLGLNPNVFDIIAGYNESLSQILKCIFYLVLNTYLTIKEDVKTKA